MSVRKSAAARLAAHGPAPRTREAAAPETALARLDALAAQAEARFRATVDAAVHETHEAGFPVAVLGQDGRPAWLHPDGTFSPADPFGPVPHP